MNRAEFLLAAWQVSGLVDRAAETAAALAAVAVTVAVLLLYALSDVASLSA